MASNQRALPERPDGRPPPDKNQITGVVAVLELFLTGVRVPPALLMLLLLLLCLRVGVASLAKVPGFLARPALAFTPRLSFCVHFSSFCAHVCARMHLCFFVARQHMKHTGLDAPAVNAAAEIAGADREMPITRATPGIFARAAPYAQTCLSCMAVAAAALAERPAVLPPTQ